MGDIVDVRGCLLICGMWKEVRKAGVRDDDEDNDEDGDDLDVEDVIISMKRMGQLMMEQLS